MANLAIIGLKWAETAVKCVRDDIPKKAAVLLDFVQITSKHISCLAGSPLAASAPLINRKKVSPVLEMQKLRIPAVCLQGVIT